jgi:hypothetical protein
VPLRHTHWHRNFVTVIEAIKELVKEGRDAKARGDFVTVRAPEDAAKLYEEMTGRVATWLVPAAAPRV